MQWTSIKRGIRSPKSFDKNGNYRGGFYIDISTPKEKTEVSKDTEIRLRVRTEIDERCSKGENIDEVVREIAERREIKENFSYWTKNGITDIGKKLKEMYESYKKSESKTNRFRIER